MVVSSLGSGDKVWIARPTSWYPCFAGRSGNAMIPALQQSTSTPCGHADWISNAARRTLSKSARSHSIARTVPPFASAIFLTWHEIPPARSCLSVDTAIQGSLYKAMWMLSVPKSKKRTSRVKCQCLSKSVRYAQEMLREYVNNSNQHRNILQPCNAHIEYSKCHAFEDLCRNASYLFTMPDLIIMPKLKHLP